MMKTIQKKSNPIENWRSTFDLWQLMRFERFVSEFLRLSLNVNRGRARECDGPTQRPARGRNNRVVAYLFNRGQSGHRWILKPKCASAPSCGSSPVSSRSNTNMQWNVHLPPLWLWLWLLLLVVSFLTVSVIYWSIATCSVISLLEWLSWIAMFVLFPYNLTVISNSRCSIHHTSLYM